MYDTSRPAPSATTTRLGWRKVLLGSVPTFLLLIFALVVVGLRIFNLLDDEACAWLSNAPLILLLVIVFFPWIRDSFIAARKQASQRS